MFCMVMIFLESSICSEAVEYHVLKLDAIVDAEVGLGGVGAINFDDVELAVFGLLVAALLTEGLDA